MRTEFFLPMIPPTTTQQMHKVKIVNGKPQFYDSDDLKAARVKLTAHLSGHIPEQKYTGAVRLVVKWCFPMGSHKDGEWKTTRPDTDNLQKLFKDILTGLKYWTDDAIVASEIIEKFWAERPGIYVCIENL